MSKILAKIQVFGAITFIVGGELVLCLTAPEYGAFGAFAGISATAVALFLAFVLDVVGYAIGIVEVASILATAFAVTITYVFASIGFGAFAIGIAAAIPAIVAAQLANLVIDNYYVRKGE